VADKVHVHEVLDAHQLALDQDQRAGALARGRPPAGVPRSV
jgi:hypothetical protein